MRCKSSLRQREKTLIRPTSKEGMDSTGLAKTSELKLSLEYSTLAYQVLGIGASLAGAAGPCG